MLSISDFPGFFTIKNFLIMLDGIYTENFFLRKEDKELLSDEKDDNKMDINLSNRKRFFIKN